MKARRLCNPAEVGALYEHIGQQLALVGLRSRPEVVSKLLQLISDDQAAIGEYARTVAGDPVLAGRVLRLANSALYAQRSPVTTVERACVILGVGRLRALALGFYASRAAAHDPLDGLSRSVWTRSVYRACLSAGLARRINADRAPEAFLVGLLLEAGVPLIAQMLGMKFIRLYESEPDARARFAQEFETLPFTSVDVIATMARSWRLPALLVRPLEWQHQAPVGDVRHDDTRDLHRIAYAVASAPIEVGAAERHAPAPSRLAGAFGLTSDDVRDVLDESAMEYHATIAVFHDVADEMTDIESRFERVRERLIEALSMVVEQGIAAGAAMSRDFRVGGRVIRLEALPGGIVLASLMGVDGRAVVRQELDSMSASCAELRTSFSLEAMSADECELMTEFVRQASQRAA